MGESGGTDGGRGRLIRCKFRVSGISRCIFRRVSGIMRFHPQIVKMGLSIGITGLPNVGKSTLFNALTRAQNAQSANYPFCTIEPNFASVPVPDARLAALAAIAKPQKIINATVEFTDIAGLVRGASKGEGLGNKFLANIRECDAILHVVRCFADENVTHVEGSVDPARDAEIINGELLLADMETVENKVQRLTKTARTDKDARKELDAALLIQKHLEEGKPARTFEERDSDEMRGLLRDLRLLTDKKVIYVGNVSEAEVATGALHSNAAAILADYAKKEGAACVVICAKIEEDMAGISDAERAEFLAEYGIAESGLDLIVKTGYETLGLQSFLTAGPKEVRAWTIREGWTAPKAAGVIHTDFERGFIRAQVISFDDFVAHGGEQQCKALGLARLEGKEYVMRDGDVVEFLFNV